MILGFLHTSPVHVETFRHLVAGRAQVREVVDEQALTVARTGADVDALVLADLRQLADCDVVVCTCSTLGGVAERLGATALGRGPLVQRVDRAMARRAVDYERVAVVAALESTVAPTLELLREEAAAAGRNPALDVYLAPDAWALFEAGDADGYLREVGRVARAAATGADVLVLAQASMALLTGLLTDVPVPVLASPALAVEAALSVGA